MKYLKTFFVMIILLNMQNLYNAEAQKPNPEVPTPAGQETPIAATTASARAKSRTP